jgi:hypothetical protein
MGWFNVEKNCCEGVMKNKLFVIPAVLLIAGCAIGKDLVQSDESKNQNSAALAREKP